MELESVISEATRLRRFLQGCRRVKGNCRKAINRSWPGKLDGANAFAILIKIVVPISKPFIATFSLFYAVERWNEWYNAMLYISKKTYQPLQIYLRELLVNLNSPLSAQAQMMMGETQKIQASTVQMACIVVTMVPILCIYPFVQKHFVKGIMVGGIKG